MKKLRKLFLIMIGVVLLGCHPALQKECERPEDALVPVSSFYPEFHDDSDLSSLAAAIRINMEYLGRLNPEHQFVYGPHTYTCQHVLNSQKAFLDLIDKRLDSKELNKRIRKEFLVYRATGRAGNRSVLFTGYFEPTFRASTVPTEAFRHPIYKKPDDLQRIDLSPFREDLKGKSIIARVEDRQVLPYYTRKEIDTDRTLSGKNLELAWLKDPLDVAFLQVQGSGRLRLPDDRIIRVGYHESNGRPYQSIGRYMIEKGFLTREEMSMQNIRRYLNRHPEVMEEVLNHNPSYVFFRPTEGGPFGNINVPLTPGRSLALDNKLFPKGALCFISSKKPVLDSMEEITAWADFSRFMLHQDTGGAINGAGRADIFWGNDLFAEMAAGHMKHEGEIYLLVKRP